MKNIRKFETVAEYEAWMRGDAVYPNVCYVAEDGRIAYNPPPPLPLYIEALENLTVTFSNTYEYSKDNKTWTSGTSSTTISANAGEKVYFRASGLVPASSNGIGRFNITTGKCNVGGNVMSMAYGADFEGKTEITQKNQFRKLFRSCYIVNADKLVLPATTLSAYCYGAMFEYCKYLVSTPELPATALNSGSYSNMFGSCSALVNAPALPATTLATSCYDSMFSGCSSLVNAPALPATTLETQCYGNMFYSCTSLVKAPELPATTLVSKCYNLMFYGCTNLNYIKAMFTNAPGLNTDMWVSGVSATGTFVKNSAATWADDFRTSAIPEGWTVELADA